MGKNLLVKKEPTAETDQLSHVYTLLVKPDNTYEVFVDGESKQKGSLEEDWDFLEPRKIKDPELSKPDDWVDDAKMILKMLNLKVGMILLNKLMTQKLRNQKIGMTKPMVNGS